MKPEEKARVKIDQMFEDAGWKVVDRDFYSPTLTAAAIREGLLEGNREADYFLFINGMAVGVLEAKRKEVDVTSDKVCEQADLYARGVPECYKAYSRPLPIIYQSNAENRNVVESTAFSTRHNPIGPHTISHRCEDFFYYLTIERLSAKMITFAHGYMSFAVSLSIDLVAIFPSGFSACSSRVSWELSQSQSHRFPSRISSHCCRISIVRE